MNHLFVPNNIDLINELWYIIDTHFSRLMWHTRFSGIYIKCVVNTTSTDGGVLYDVSFDNHTYKQSMLELNADAILRRGTKSDKVKLIGDLIEGALNEKQLGQFRGKWLASKSWLWRHWYLVPFYFYRRWLLAIKKKGD